MNRQNQKKRINNKLMNFSKKLSIQKIRYNLFLVYFSQISLLKDEYKEIDYKYKDLQENKLQEIQKVSDEYEK